MPLLHVRCPQQQQQQQQQQQHGQQQQQQQQLSGVAAAQAAAASAGAGSLSISSSSAVSSSNSLQPADSSNSSDASSRSSSRSSCCHSKSNRNSCRSSSGICCKRANGTTTAAAAAKHSSVQVWLTELRWYAEADCSNVLHSKAIPLPPNSQQQQHQQQQLRCFSVLPPAPAAAVQMLELKSQMVMEELRNVMRCISQSQFKLLHTSTHKLLHTLQAFIQDLSILLQPPSPSLQQKLQHMANLSSKISSASEQFLNVNGRLPPVQTVAILLNETSEAFGQLADCAAQQLLAAIVRAVLHKTSGANFTSALHDLVRLATRSQRLSELVAHSQAVPALLKVCRDGSQRKYWPAVLRTLAAVCCLEHAILAFEQAAGIAVMTEILISAGSSQLARAEAAGVVAQVTSPCAASGSHLLASLSAHTHLLLWALTMLCREATTQEEFLLAAAAIANITFLCPASFEYLLSFRTVHVLVGACQLTKASSLFAKDQVATVLANMAAYSWCHKTVTSENGIELLLHFLSESPGAYGDSASRAACERLQQKAAIALSRLARDASSSQIVLELNGAQRLAELCRRPEERNCSDAVLVAALACLRHLHHAVGSQEFCHRDLSELLLPRLLQAFVACSRIDESYV